MRAHVLSVLLSRGGCRYGFIEFANESDVKTAFKKGDGKKIDGRWVVVVFCGVLWRAFASVIWSVDRAC